MRCHADAGKLRFGDTSPTVPTRVADGLVHCTTCDAAYPIEAGILRLLLGPQALDPESAYEAAQRDREAAEFDHATGEQQGLLNALEVPAHLDALRLVPGCATLEFGCSTGRLTLELVARGSRVLAVDFSLASLQLLAEQLPADAPIALVYADLTQLALAPQAFDRALATCTSNMPTRAHRLAMLQLAADSLRPDGRFVFSAYNHTWLHRLRREATAGRYGDDTSVVWRRFRPGELARETAPFFANVDYSSVVPARRYLQRPLPTHPALRALVPLLQRAARVIGRVPGLRGFGWLWMMTADTPRREPALPAPARDAMPRATRALATLAFVLGLTGADAVTDRNAARAAAAAHPLAAAGTHAPALPSDAHTSGAATTQISATTAADAMHHAHTASITNSSRYVRYTEYSAPDSASANVHTASARGALRPRTHRHTLRSPSSTTSPPYSPSPSAATGTAPTVA